MSKLDELQALITDPDKGLDWQQRAFEQLLRDRCLLLAAAREATQTSRWSVLTDLLASGDWTDAAHIVTTGLLRADENHSPLGARVEVLRAADSYARLAELGRHFQQALEQLRGYWPDQAGTGAGTERRPAWYHLLSSRCQQQFDRLVPAEGWLRMSTHVVGSSLAWVQGRWQRPEEVANPPAQSVSTWVLFAVGDETWADGLVGQLRLDRVARGGGFFYPDPLTGGYLRLDGSFHDALRNAWLAIMGEQPAAVDYDVCWSLSLRIGANSAGWWPTLSGRSGEAAIACALRDQEPLDENVAVTAALEEPLERSRLVPVERVLDKLLAHPFCPELARRRIRQVVVSRRQPEAGQSFDNGRLLIVPADGLPDAYDLLSRYAKARRGLRQQIDQAGTAALRDDCIGESEDGFVRPRLSRRRELAGDRLALGRDESQQQYDPLTPDQREDLASGRRWLDPQSPRLVRILADSGAGKSMFLAYCQQQMARTDHELVPLRLEHLSDIHWQAADPYAVIAGKLPWPDEPKLKDDERHEIVRELCEQGRLVLLLDAIDQTTTTRGLGGWLDKTKGKLAACPVILTGRTSTESLPLFQDGRWETLRLDAFQRPEQEEFLGPVYLRLLLRTRRGAADDAPEAQREPEDDPATRRRKQHWAPLLGVPMLLKLMKQLAVAGQLADLTNREQVYRRATRWLIERGLATLQHTGRQPLTLDETERFLARLAWASIGGQGHVRGNFTGRVAGRDYTEALLVLDPSRSERKQVEQSLDQINVFTKYSFLGERREDGIEWRHRSFLEYFAAMALCNQSEDQQTASVASVHDHLAAVAAVRGGEDSERQAADDERTVRPADQWQWVYRFALSRAMAERSRGTLRHLARQLIAHGNPYVVYESMTEDDLEGTLDAPLGRLARWLVHQTLDLRNFRGAWKSEGPPEVDAETLAILHTLFDRRYRNGPVLPPAWQLVESCLPRGEEAPATPLQQAAVAIRELFLGDWDQQVAGERALSEAERRVLTEFLNSFVACPPEDFDFSKSGDQLREVGQNEYVFRMGASPDDKEADDDERPRHWVRLRGFRMSEFCVTNGVLELMDPSHFWYRDRFSREDDQPALWVNWYMGRLFGLWLTGLARRAVPGSHHDYRLPTECEWEFAARGGSGAKWWWGDVFKREHCNIGKAGEGFQTLGRSRTTPSHRNGFGLYHMAGNNWQWCQDVFDAAWYAKRTGVSGEASKPHDTDGEYPADEGCAGVGGRVCRGGSFSYLARLCRSSYRSLFVADFLHYRLGFRLCGGLSLSESSSGTLNSELASGGLASGGLASGGREPAVSPAAGKTHTSYPNDL